MHTKISTNNKLYKAWDNMKQRCTNPNHKYYKDYGGRGISICNQWLKSKNFIKDMYPTYQDGLTLDRIDVNGNYEPNNCRWTTKTIQARNTRKLRADNTSGYRGVSWFKRDSKWQVQIKVNTRKIHLGVYETQIEAAKAYDKFVNDNNLIHPTNF